MSKEKTNQEETHQINHLAIIADGNRRWARAKNLQPFIGHQTAVDKTIPALVDRALALNIPYLTFWFFSTENWQRDPVEVDYLLNLMRLQFDRQVKAFHKKNIRIKVIGRRSDFPKDIQIKFHQWEDQTKNNTTLTLTFALSYGGHDELVRAFNKIWQTRASADAPLEITPELIVANLDTADFEFPNPDLIIRTSQELRLSGFMSWQSAYSEFYFAPENFPDFLPPALDTALADFSARQRRFGK